ncbi:MULTISPECIES: hypothetical protein [unclassified Moorena]|uniref:hypothetical protein n=1 Tax=unclassified Moorena TaxID=2683338 RepID=UPI001400F616|nr:MULTISPECIES: hypothetical protein [unclassified Moorena]NEO15667.1 hypothetical protein [Moorena sp. SIO3E8]NEQ02090.1 hypothetical protein [Moorena sp. SIO3F7]
MERGLGGFPHERLHQDTEQEVSPTRAFHQNSKMLPFCWEHLILANISFYFGGIITMIQLFAVCFFQSEMLLLCLGRSFCLTPANRKQELINTG